MMSLVGRYVRGGLVSMESFDRFSCHEHLHNKFCGIESAVPYYNRYSTLYLNVSEYEMRSDS
jgi:hypothetical protein